MNIESNNGWNSCRRLAAVIMVVLVIVGLALMAIFFIGGGLTGLDISGFQITW